MASESLVRVRTRVDVGGQAGTRRSPRFTPGVDAEAVTGVARDTNWAVRRDLAQAISNLTRGGDDDGAVSEQCHEAIGILRGDPSFGVGSALAATRLSPGPDQERGVHTAS